MFTNELDLVVKDYLTANDTDYAIMISGDWGSGKSYYIFHGLTSLINETQVPKEKKAENTKSKNDFYSLAYISLYGLSSAEDLEVRVFRGINPWLSNRFWRFSGLITTKIAEFFGVSAEKEDAELITIIKKNTVLVFDDLERICEDKIPVKEVLGLINSYAEHSHHKVIIVCNESVYNSEDTDSVIKDSYKKYKEKSVRFTYEYSPDESAAYDAMVSSIPVNDYQVFLNSRKDSILSLFKIGGRRNLRTLKFIIDTFGKLFFLTNGTKFRDRINDIYLVTFALYSFEYKQGHSSEELGSLDISKFKFDPSSFLNLKRNSIDAKDDKKEDFETEFMERYESVFNDFHPCRVILDYIESGYLDSEVFQKEVQKLNDELERQTLKPEGVVYQKLLRMAELEDDNVPPLIEEMMSYVREGKYNIYDLLSVYELLVKYDCWGIGGFELSDSIDNSFRIALERQKDVHKFNWYFDINTPIYDSSEANKRLYEKYKAMKDIAMDINRQAKKNEEAEDGNLFMIAAEDGKIEKMRQFRASRDHSVPISGLDWKRVVKVITESPNTVACETCECLISFLSTSTINDDEINRIKRDLIPYLDDYLDSGTRQIRRLYISELRKHLESIVKSCS